MDFRRVHPPIDLAARACFRLSPTTFLAISSVLIFLLRQKFLHFIEHTVPALCVIVP